MSPSRKPDAARATSNETAGLARKPVARASSSVHLTQGALFPKKPAGRTLGKPVETKRDWIGIRLHEKDREIILQQLFRCMGKYDPRAIPRIISKRTGITEQAVDFVIQGTCREFEEWRREIRQAIARADEAGAAAWKRTA